MPTTVRSHAKINLGLYIGAPRPDGFHGLVTVYQTLEWHDLVTVTVLDLKREASASPSIRITTNDPRVPTDNRNTVWKMAELLLREGGLSAQVDIHIEKRLPVQGGLGAGSANAVAALFGLEAELSSFAKLTPEDRPRWQTLKHLGLLGSWGAKRLEMAAHVGSDVPLFVIGGTVLGVDRGQQVYPLPDIEPVWCVVATPAVGVSTPQAFRDWDALCIDNGLTPEASADKLDRLSRAYASAFSGAIPIPGSIPEGQQGAGSSGVLPYGENLAGPQESALVRTGILTWIANDFEQVVFAQHPSLAEIKRILAAADLPEAALHASLSGSGSALFGLYQTRGDAEAACRRLHAAGVASQLTRTVPRERYWNEMLL